MKIFSQILLAAAFFLMLSCAYAERPIVSSNGYEIIVKFAADHLVTETIARSLDDPNSDASFEKPVDRLSTEVGVPFVYVRYTSGREVIVRVPTRLVYKEVVARLRESDQVESISIEKRASDDLPNPPDEILVTLDDRNYESGHGAPDHDVDLDALAAHLVNDDRFPVFCEIRPDGRLVVTPDLQHLVATLTKNLSRRGDIEYAQADFRVRHYNTSQ